MKPILKNNQQGIAMLIAIMVLSLGGSIALIAFRSSTQELELSRLTEHEMNSQYLAESGVDQVVAWVMDPALFPTTYSDYEIVRTFFVDLPRSLNPCLKDSDHPDLEISDDAFLAHINGPFSELKSMGEIKAIKFYAPLNQTIPPSSDDRRLCTLEITAISGSGAIKTIRVDLGSSPIGEITSVIQGIGSTSNPLPVWSHWGGIDYTGDATFGTDLIDILRVPRPGGSYGDVTHYSDVDFQTNFDPAINIRVENNITSPPPDDGGDSFNDRPNVTQQNGSVTLDRATLVDSDLRRFLRRNGEHYTVTGNGKLEKNGIVRTFDEFFKIPDGSGSPDARLVWISGNSTAPVAIDGGRYKGYFFFSGDITISSAGQSGRVVIAKTPGGETLTLSGINLEGLFYTRGSMTIQDDFTAYGAFFSRGGFTGAGTQNLEVWYNSAFADAVFPGIRSVTPLSGTWATLASDDS